MDRQPLDTTLLSVIILPGIFPLSVSSLVSSSEGGGGGGGALPFHTERAGFSFTAEAPVLDEVHHPVTII